MSGIVSVEFSYPSLTQTSPKFSPSLRPRSCVTNRITCSSGTVGYYDITELSDQIKYFGISEETRRAITRKQKTSKSSALRRTNAVRSTPCDMLCTNKNARFKSREHPMKVSSTRSCYIDFTGSFNDEVRAQPLPLATRHSAPVIRQRFIPTSSRTTQGKRRKAKPKEAWAPESAQIKGGLLVIANGKIVDLKKDIRRSEKLEEDERRRLRKEMRQHLDIVRSFDDLFQELGETKRQLEELKAT